MIARDADELAELHAQRRMLEDAAGIEVLDWRHRHDGRTKVSLRRGKPLVRRPEEVTDLVIHQTACIFGPASDRDRRLARALRIGAHATAFREGVGVIAIPLLHRGIHANALNHPSLGLEIEGRYSGRRDDPSTVPDEAKLTAWNGHADDVTHLLIATARATIQTLVELAALDGIVLRYMRAHRQANWTRRADPGEELWTEVGAWGAREFGLEIEHGRTWASASGKGRPIPKAWGGAGAY